MSPGRPLARKQLPRPPQRAPLPEKDETSRVTSVLRCGATAALSLEAPCHVRVHVRVEDAGDNGLIFPI